MESLLSREAGSDYYIRVACRCWQFTFGRRKVKMIEVGSVLRSRDGLRFYCGDAGLSYTRSVD